MTNVIHIVTAAHAISGANTYVALLQRLLLANDQHVQIWHDRPGPGAGQAINSFARQFPVGGTLILIGSYLRLDPWLAYSRPQRLIFICNTSEPTQTFRTLAQLSQQGLPQAEVVYVSQRLHDSIRIPGHVFPELVDLDVFQPAADRPERPVTIGRLSRDHPDKHHADDVALYRMLAWHNAQVRILGGTCLQNGLQQINGITLLPAGSEHPADFLRSLDIFFYRTSTRLHEAAGRAVMEAMACGLPIVAHASGGYTDWIHHEENGLLFSTQEEGWNCLLRLSQDKNLRDQLGSSARRSAIVIADAKGHAASAYIRWLTSPSSITAQTAD